MSLFGPEPVDSVLTFLSGYDTLEYSWVKATAVSVRLGILFVMLQNTNKHHPCACWIPSLGTLDDLGAVVIAVSFLAADLFERPLCTCLTTG